MRNDYFSLNNIYSEYIHFILHTNNLKDWETSQKAYINLALCVLQDIGWWTLKCTISHIPINTKTKMGGKNGKAGIES